MRWFSGVDDLLTPKILGEPTSNVALAANFGPKLRISLLKLQQASVVACCSLSKEILNLGPKFDASATFEIGSPRIFGAMRSAIAENNRMLIIIIQAD